MKSNTRSAFLSAIAGTACLFATGFALAAENQNGGDQNQGSGDQNQGSGDQNQGSGDQNQGSGDQNQGSGDQNQGSGDQNQGGSQRDLPDYHNDSPYDRYDPGRRFGDVALHSFELNGWSDLTRCSFSGCWRDARPREAFRSFTVAIVGGRHVRLGKTFYVQCVNGDEFKFPIIDAGDGYGFAREFPNHCPGFWTKKITMQAGLDTEHDDSDGTLVYFGNF